MGDEVMVSLETTNSERRAELEVAPAEVLGEDGTPSWKARLGSGNCSERVDGTGSINPERAILGVIPGELLTGLTVSVSD